MNPFPNLSQRLTLIKRRYGNVTKTVVFEVADKEIRVNGIAPGAIATDMNKEILKDEQKKKAEEMNSYAQNRPARRNSQSSTISSLR
jgi:NAD(P)-dependent dehydrogenase (short-subunit alcohol dehydrogenase family)